MIKKQGAKKKSVVLEGHKKGVRFIPPLMQLETIQEISLPK